MRNTEEVIVGEDRYLVTHYPATSSGELFIELTKKLGPALTALLKGDQDAKVDMQLVVNLIEKAVPNFERGDFTRLAKECFIGTLAFVGEKNVALNEVYDIHFQGRLSHLYKVLAAVLKFQYSDFLGGPAAPIPSVPAGATPKGARPIKAV